MNTKTVEARNEVGSVPNGREEAADVVVAATEPHKLGLAGAI